MSEFGTPTIGDPTQGASETPPPNTSIDAMNAMLSDRQQQQALIEEKIKLFRCAVRAALFAFAVLVLLLVIVVIKYLCFLKEGIMLPSNFWHIPLLLAIMASMTLSVTLGLASRFGDNHKKDKDNSLMLSNIPAWQELSTSLKELIQAIRK